MLSDSEGRVGQITEILGRWMAEKWVAAQGKQWVVGVAFFNGTSGDASVLEKLRPKPLSRSEAAARHARGSAIQKKASGDD
jgi:hypothetical protein